LLGCITTVFFVCWGPLVFYTILYEFLPEIFPQRSVMASVGYTLSLLFGMLTPIANPGTGANVTNTISGDFYKFRRKIGLFLKRNVIIIFFGRNRLKFESKLPIFLNFLVNIFSKL
jgi:hypothetical protein